MEDIRVASLNMKKRNGECEIKVTVENGIKDQIDVFGLSENPLAWSRDG